MTVSRNFKRVSRELSWLVNASLYMSQVKNVKRLRDYAYLWRFTRRMYQHPGIRPTCHLDDIKAHYYWSQPTVNPTRIVPRGPGLEADLDVPI